MKINLIFMSPVFISFKISLLELFNILLNNLYYSADIAFNASVSKYSFIERTY